MAALTKPVDWDELYPGRFIKAGEFKGKKPTLTIKDVDVESLAGDDGKEKVKGIISFVETPKQLPLNKTNGICLRAMFGRKLPDWVGKRVILYADKWNGEEATRIWGSPDITEEMAVEVKLPRKKPINMTMHTKAAA
jgi:hypothetical protein